MVLSDENMAIADWMQRHLSWLWELPDVETLAMAAHNEKSLQWLGSNLGICRKIAGPVLAFTDDSSRPLTSYMIEVL